MIIEIYFILYILTMFQHYLTAGKHMICDLKNIQNKELLNDADKLNEMLGLICRDYQFQVVEKIHKCFILKVVQFSIYYLNRIFPYIPFQKRIFSLLIFILVENIKIIQNIWKYLTVYLIL